MLLYPGFSLVFDEQFLKDLFPLQFFVDSRENGSM